ncbi:MAG: 3-dehydroquinate synthase [Chitinophagaceae bacterium]|nr:3-dehydroquinate synthase [Chitinophagaceae bacterium]
MSTHLFYIGDEIAFQQFIASKSYTKIVLLSDANTHGFCVPVLKKKLPLFVSTSQLVIPQGESSKQLDLACYIWEELAKLGADKQTLLVNVGGGVLSDLGGFCASIYKRGIDYINIPTTLLAMVDASIGGKTGLDFLGYKNFLGTFTHPEAVFVWPQFLQTLAERNLKSGMAEMIKHQLLGGEVLHASQEELTSLAQIQWSIQYKESIVNQDPYDQGLRQILNLGHSLGHAIESASFNTSFPLLHGEAIILGLIIELRLSELMFDLSTQSRTELINIQHNLFVDLPTHFSYEVLKGFLLQDKKNNQAIKMSLLTAEGECGYGIHVTEELIQQALLTAFELD